MKYIFAFSILVISMISCSSPKQTYSIAPNDSIELDYPNYDSYEAKISNKSNEDIEVKIIDKESSEKISGFGLGNMSTEKVMVGNNNKLIVKNSGSKTAKVFISMNNKDVVTVNSEPTYISFTLRNNSAKSIPLIIPTVMNPNLSPFSNSGVDLKIGQEIIFKHNGKKYVLLTVSEKIKNGEVLEVSNLLKEKKKELGI